VVTKFREWLTVSKKEAQEFEGKIYPKETKWAGVKEQCQSNISNKSAALETLSDVQDIYRAWENIKEIIKTSAK